MVLIQLMQRYCQVGSKSAINMIMLAMTCDVACHRAVACHGVVAWQSKWGVSNPQNSDRGMSDHTGDSDNSHTFSHHNTDIKMVEIEI